MLSFAYCTSFELTIVLFRGRRKAVSFHAVSFGPDGYSLYLRRMADIARDAQNNTPRDPLAPVTATVVSSYTQALDTVRDIFCSSQATRIPIVLVCTVLGPTCGDVPGYCRVVAKAERGTDALKSCCLSCLGAVFVMSIVL